MSLTTNNVITDKLTKESPDYIWFCNQIAFILDDIMHDFVYFNSGSLLTESSTDRFPITKDWNQTIQGLEKLYLSKRFNIDKNDILELFAKLGIDKKFQSLKNKSAFHLEELDLTKFNKLLEACERISTVAKVSYFDDELFTKTIKPLFLQVYDENHVPRAIRSMAQLLSKPNNKNFERFIKVCREHKQLGAMGALRCSIPNLQERFMFYDKSKDPQTTVSQFNETLKELVSSFEIKGIPQRQNTTKKKDRKALKH